jgi:hypothetical protein
MPIFSDSGDRNAYLRLKRPVLLGLQELTSVCDSFCEILFASLLIRLLQSSCSPPRHLALLSLCPRRFVPSRAPPKPTTQRPQPPSRPSPPCFSPTNCLTLSRRASYLFAPWPSRLWWSSRFRRPRSLPPLRQRRFRPPPPFLPQRRLRTRAPFLPRRRLRTLLPFLPRRRLRTLPPFLPQLGLQTLPPFLPQRGLRRLLAQHHLPLPRRPQSPFPRRSLRPNPARNQSAKPVATAATTLRRAKAPTVTKKPHAVAATVCRGALCGIRYPVKQNTRVLSGFAARATVIGSRVWTR